MPKRVRQARRLTMALTEDGLPRIKRLASEAGLREDEAPCFV